MAGQKKKAIKKKLTKVETPIAMAWNAQEEDEEEEEEDDDDEEDEEEEEEEEEEGGEEDDKEDEEKKEEEVLSIDVNGAFAASYHSFRLLAKVNKLKKKFSI